LAGVWHRQASGWSPGTDAVAERLAVAVDGATPLEHGWVRGEDDPGDDLADALATLRDASSPATALTRITRSTFRSLEAIGASVRDADAWVLIVPEVRSERALSARLAMALPWALRAATRWGERAFLCGVPLCLVGPHTARVLAEPGRAFGEPCDGCDARERCPGVGAGYLERFGARELRPREPGALGPLASDLVPGAARTL
jgi:hypothetical protein